MTGTGAREPGELAVLAARLRLIDAVLARPVPSPLRAALLPEDAGVARRAVLPAQSWAQALQPSIAERRAARAGTRAGWLDPREAARLVGPGALERRVAALPGNGSDEAELVLDVMAELHRDLARAPWIETALDAAARGAAPDIRLQVYLDASGSVPSPLRTASPLVVAALVLVRAALRAGGRARIVLFSSAPVPFLEWSDDEKELARFAMHYVGAGTVFPLEHLRDSFAAGLSLADPARLEQLRNSVGSGPCPTHLAVLTDGDLRGGPSVGGDIAVVPALAFAARTTPLAIVALGPSAEAAASYRHAGARVATTRSPAGLVRAAARLAPRLLTAPRARPPLPRRGSTVGVSNQRP